jgi:hypothetical protein
LSVASNHPNNLGSTTFVTDETGATIQKTIYYPWGQSWASAGTIKRVATVNSPVIDRGLFLDNEPTVNSNCELTVATSCGRVTGSSLSRSTCVGGLNPFVPLNAPFSSRPWKGRGGGGAFYSTATC